MIFPLTIVPLYNPSMSYAASFKRNVTILALCQALFASGISLVVSTTALVGFALASDKAYASLPFTAQLVATMLTSIPASMLMARLGRRASYLIATVIAMLGSVLSTLGIVQQNFWLFLAGNVALGMFSGFANYYRFTAADSVDVEYKSRAISYVMVGGVIAAFIGPNLANFTRDIISHAAFAGSYAATMVLYILSFTLLAFLKLPHTPYKTVTDTTTDTRPLRDIVGQPRFIIAVICGMLGYAVMSLVMTATPLAMQVCEYPFSDTSFVIQWHVLAMFAPSFFTGHLIRRFGLLTILITGALFGLACVAINLNGTTVSHFWTALVLLGLSWNFLFIGGTTLLTETYRPEEKFKAQALNDFMVFSMVATASLSSGILQHYFGWRFVNYSAIPALAIILVSLGWLYSVNRSNALTLETGTIK